MKLEVVVQLVVVPVGLAHLQATMTRLCRSIQRFITEDVGEVVTTRPVLRTNASVPPHSIGGREVVPGAVQTD
jgi:hypothetical protein